MAGFHRWVSARREELGESVSGLAKASGWHYNAWRRWEQTERPVRLAAGQVAGFSKALRVTPAVVLDKAGLLSGELRELAADAGLLEVRGGRYVVDA